MSLLFLCSSVGDTNLAKATINTLKAQNPHEIYYVVPLTNVAENETKTLADTTQIQRILYPEIVTDIHAFIKKQAINHVYIGVPSVDNALPFQIAQNLAVPFTIAYEYMFKPKDHVFWQYVKPLAEKEACQFAVPLQKASEDILSLSSTAKVFKIGHLSLDAVTRPEAVNPNVRAQLSVCDEDDLVFLSGTTQPHEVDAQYVQALLAELATGKYPHIQIRMGMHPGVQNFDNYLNKLIATCAQYPQLANQFKLVMTPSDETKMKALPDGDHKLLAILDNHFILRADVSGPEIAKAAANITQAVPGALLNEAACRGKPSYFPGNAVAYLPSSWFARDLPTFFNGKKQQPHTLAELDLHDTAPNMLANILK